MNEDQRSMVSISRCTSYDLDEVAEAVRRALAPLGGLSAFVWRGQTVLLKPNLLTPRIPEIAATTHPAVLDAAAREVLEIGAKPVIGDSPPFRGQKASSYEYLLRVTGMRAVADRLGVEVVSLDRPYREVEVPGRLFKRLPIAAAYLDADVVISLPKLKTHGLTAYTGAIKNMFGCVPGLNKSRLHLQAAEDRVVFAQMLVDVFAACPPSLTIMDAVVGMEGSGPGSGLAKEIGAILVSADAVALDAVACEMVGISPPSVDTTRLAAEQGLGMMDLRKLEILGEDLDSMRIRGFKPSPTVGGGLSEVPKSLRGLLRNQLVPMPRVRRDRCVGCGDCVKVCAIGAMELRPGTGRTARHVAYADLRKCIACYCCDEVCPYDAIIVRKGLLGELVRRTKSRA